MDQPDLPANKPAVYGRPTNPDASGQPETPPLFEGPIQHDQVRRGDLNDCWIMSNEVTQDQATCDWIATGKRLALDVSPEVPVHASDTSVAIFADTRASNVTWVAVLEKAFAGLDQTSCEGHPQRARVGYDRLDEGGSASDTAQVLAQLTGERAGVIDVSTASDPVAETERVIGDALAAGKPVVVGTFGAGHPQASLPYGFQGPHAYDVTSSHQGRMTIRNPLGMLHPQPVTASQLVQVIDGEISTLR